MKASNADNIIMSIQKITSRMSESRKARRNARAIERALAACPTEASRQELLVIARAA